MINEGGQSDRATALFYFLENARIRVAEYGVVVARVHGVHVVPVRFRVLRFKPKIGTG